MEKNVLNNKCVVIGGSAGSLQVILYILSHLKPEFPIPVVIILHRKNDYDSTLSEVIAQRSGLPVKEADDKEPVLPGMIYLAPANYHLLIENNHTFSLDDSEKVNYSRPSIDVTFQTAADAYGAGTIAILLSGANADGTDGLAYIRDHKGTLIVQNPADATVPYMPQSAIDSQLAQYILTKEEIASFLNKYIFV